VEVRGIALISPPEPSSSILVSARTARVSLALCSDPSARIFIPVVTRVRYAPQGRIDVVQSALVVEASPDQVGNEGVPVLQPCPLVEFSNEVVVQVNA